MTGRPAARGGAPCAAYSLIFLAKTVMSLYQIVTQGGDRSVLGHGRVFRPVSDDELR